jgi:fatty-acyl-CoA synthase
MLGQMMEMPLTIGSLIEHAERYHSHTEIVSVETTGEQTTSNWGTVGQNARKLSSALRKLGIVDGERCATIAWNNRRHLESYFGISGGGMVCHTINPRLAPEQLAFVVNDAQDKVLFFEQSFLPLIVKIRPLLETVLHFVVMGPHCDDAAQIIDGVVFYDELLTTGEADTTWPDVDERAASSLCYTSGTTGNPKGVLYSHRSTLLHTLAANQPDGIALSAQDTVLPVVPMFHVNAWGVPYIAAANGCKLVLPGPNLDGKSILTLIDETKTTIALGVPTIWMTLLEALEDSDTTLPSLTRTVVGGAALPPSMIPKFAAYGVELLHAWGMTETSPVATINQFLQRHAVLSEQQKTGVRTGQGRPLFGVDLRLLDENGGLLPHDGKAQGDLQVRGHWVVKRYFGKETDALIDALTDDNWFDTGDVSTIDEDGYMVIRDRSKDIIKSGGEWISTVELENIAIAHPDIANAAAIAARHHKWDERPILLAVKAPNSNPSEADILAFYKGQTQSWQIPDAVIFVDTLPIGATGKVQKIELRKQFGDYLINKGKKNA